MIADLDAEDWETEVLQTTGKMVVVEFWHDECPWCNKFKPIYDQVSEEFDDQVEFTRLNVLQNEENKQIAMDNGVMSTPTLAFFCNGRSIGSAVGFMEKDELRDLVREKLDERRKCLERSSELPD